MCGFLSHQITDSDIVDLDLESACHFLSNLIAQFLIIMDNFVSQISEWDVCGFALNLLSQF